MALNLKQDWQDGPGQSMHGPDFNAHAAALNAHDAAIVALQAGGGGGGGGTTYDDTAIKARATALEGRATTLENEYTTLDGEVTTNTADITTLKNAAAPKAPSDFIIVQFGGGTTRAPGYGDFITGFYVGRAFTATKVVYQFDSVDASGNTAVELRRNGSQVASSNLTISAANQADGTGTDAARTATINQSFSAGDRAALYCTSVGTTPGKGLRAWILGTWN